MQPVIFSKKLSFFFIAAFLMLLVPPAALNAQQPDSKGTDFWLTFPGNNSTSNVSLFISGETSTSGTVTIPGIGFSAPFTVTPGAVTTIALPTSVLLTSSDVVQNNGIHVTALNEVTIYGLNQLTFTTDAYLGLPTDILGTDYINLGYMNVNVVNGTQLGIVATQNATIVTITPSVTTGVHLAGVPYPVVLNQGQTYLLRNTGPDPNDLTGTLISSTAPIAVYGGHQCANIPRGFIACDHIVEQLPPTTAWGRNFVTVPLKTRHNGDTFRFLASQANTNIQINGAAIPVVLNRGQYYETLITTSSQITSDKPILVAQYSNSTTFDGVVSDPFMMLIPPFEQFLGSYTIATPASGFRFNFINVVAPNAAVGSIQLDGVPIPAASFTPIFASGFSGAQIDISLGTHTLGGGTLPFGVFVYGFNDADSYGYPGGESLAPVATVNSITLTPETGTAPQGTTQCFDALVKDQFNNPVVGVRVDFAITGANPQAVSVFTNASGIAQLCYPGTNAGVDNIVATVGALSDGSTFTWTPAVASNVYYSKSAGDLHNVLTWGLNPDGSGANPPDFGFGKTFNLANRPGMYVMTDNWTVGGNIVNPSGSQLVINGYTLSEAGMTGGGTITGSLTSNLIITGGSGGEAGPLSFTPGGRQLNNLMLNRTGADATATLLTPLEIYGTLGSDNGTLNTGGLLTLNSDATGTARVLPLPSALSIVGAVTVERYIPARRAWRILSAPIGITGQTIFQSWQENRNNTMPDPNPNPGYGTHITGGPVFGSPANGFDQNPGAASSLKFYNSAIDNWVAQPNTNATPVGDKAWMIFIRGDRGIPLSTSSVPPTPTTLRAMGPLKIGEQVFPVNPTGFTAIGNPFASPVNFATLPKTNVQQSIWYWDPKMGGINGVGAYVNVSFNGVGWDVTPASASPESQYIQNGQGFLVRTITNAPGFLTIRESDKSATPNMDVFRVARNSSSLRISLQKINPDLSTPVVDEVFTSFTSYFSRDIDFMDVIKAPNVEENLAIVHGSELLMVERRPVISNDDVMYLKLWNTTPGDYQFEFKPERLSISGHAWLIDNYLKTATEVPVDRITPIGFRVNGDPLSAKADRFKIVFSQKKPGFESVKGYITVYPNPLEGRDLSLAFVDQPRGTYQFTLLNNLGQVVFSKTLVHNGGTTIQKVQLEKKIPLGLYQLEVKGMETISKTKLALNYQ